MVLNYYSSIEQKHLFNDQTKPLNMRGMIHTCSYYVHVKFSPRVLNKSCNDCHSWLLIENIFEKIVFCIKYSNHPGLVITVCKFIICTARNDKHKIGAIGAKRLQ